MLYRVMGCVGVGMLLVLTIAGIQHMSNGKLRNSGSLNTKYLAQLPEDNELGKVAKFASSRNRNTYFG